jgi:hypothetical protein
MSPPRSSALVVGVGASRGLYLHHQHRSAWTLELDVRPWGENF